MELVSYARFLSAKTGKTKQDTPYLRVNFLDDNDEPFSLFCASSYMDDVYNKVSQFSLNEPVEVTVRAVKTDNGYRLAITNIVSNV